MWADIPTVGHRWVRSVGAIGALLAVGPAAAAVLPGRDRVAAAPVAAHPLTTTAGADLLAVTHRGCQPSGPPMMAVVGASFTAGTGAERPDSGWAHLLAVQLGWRAEIDGVSGSGFMVPGEGGLGPMDRQLARLDLPGTRPDLVVIQSGHNDVGQPGPRLASGVRETLHLVHAADPAARVALMTVFTTGQVPDRASAAADRVIVSAARAADPGVIVIDPLQEGWRFPTIGDGLHPDQAGHRWIARRVAAELSSAGVRPYRATCPLAG